jgi:hypothetical protein
MSLQNYLRIDLAKKSEVVKELFDGMPRETDQTNIVLTPLYSTDQIPSCLTPEMSNWYATHIHALRSSAVQEVATEFERRNGVWFERQRDRIEHDKLSKISGEKDLLLQNKEVGLLRQRVEDLKSRYENLKLKYGRDALPWNPIWYWTILFFFMVPEVLINWDSFLKIPGFTEAYATGLILVVGIAFAFSAHSLGRIIKQAKELFGGHVELTEKRKAVRETIVGSLLFLLGIVAVGWGRWFFIQGAILEKTILRGGGLEFSDYLSFAGAMLGNVIVYLLGLLWSFVKHDPVPGFLELRYDLQKSQQRLMAYYDKYLTKRNQQHFQKAQRDQEQAARVEDSLKKKMDGYQAARDQFGLLKAKDAEVIALFRDYKTRLVATLKKKPTPQTFQISDVAVPELDNVVTINPDGYASMPIELRYV